MKKQSIIFTILCILSFALSLDALELKHIVTISIKNDFKIQEDSDILNNSRLITRKDGSFFFEATAPWGSVAAIVRSNGQFSLTRPINDQSFTKTNIINSFFENNELKIIQRETYTRTIFTSSPETILKTLSDKFYIDFVERYSNIITSEYIVSSKQRLLITNSEINKKYAFFVKRYPDGKYEQLFIKSENYRIQANAGVYNPFRGERYYIQDELETNDKQIVMAQVDGDLISFHRLTDPDLLSSPNRITLGSSQNGSLTATVNNPEQALLNIQSSTNLIDWNTFKTIQNEPSLEIVVPANKPKEFIRATE